LDSVSQFVLGSAIGIATLGRRTALWKAALWGGVCGTLPDLDSFVDHGNPVVNMVEHRGGSHAFFYQTMAALPIALGIAALQTSEYFGNGTDLAVWLALVTHPMLDWTTVYGTRLLLPFSEEPFGLGSMFIIDPLYTVPLAAGVAAAVALRSPRGLRWNAAGLLLSTAYLGWSALAQAWVGHLAAQELQRQGIAAERVLVTPSAFNTVLWRIVAVSGDNYFEGYASVLDADRRIDFDRFPRGLALLQRLHGDENVERIAWFSRGFYKLALRGDQAVITDLRMGSEPAYTFNFVIARQEAGGMRPVVPLAIVERPDVDRVLPWLWRRLLGERVVPPR